MFSFSSFSHSKWTESDREGLQRSKYRKKNKTLNFFPPPPQLLVFIIIFLRKGNFMPQKTLGKKAMSQTSKQIYNTMLLWKTI